MAESSNSNSSGIYNESLQLGDLVNIIINNINKWGYPNQFLAVLPFCNRISVDPESNLVQKVYLNVA